MGDDGGSWGRLGEEVGKVEGGGGVHGCSMCRMSHCLQHFLLSHHPVLSRALFNLVQICKIIYIVILLLYFFFAQPRSSGPSVADND